MGTYAIFFVLIIIVCLTAILYISIYNHMQIERTKLEKVEGLIDEDLRKKYDLIQSSIEIIKTEIKKSTDYFKDFENLKNDNISNFDLERKLTEQENIIMNFYNDNSSLNKNENMVKIIVDLKLINEKIVAGITYYNTHANDINIYIRKFPNNIIAKIHHFKIKTFFDGKNMNDDIINDFKL